MTKKELHSLLAQQEVILVGGVGGVGKTTLSAALAVAAAAQGRRVAVITIDPARRLGAALGFRKLGNKLRHTPSKKLDPFRKKPGGRLAAAMLDVKGTFDEMISRYAPNETIRDRLLGNRYYQELSKP